MIELIKKDFLLLLPERKKGRVADAIFTVTFFALFLLLEVFLFTAVMKKVDAFDGVPECIFTAFLLLALVGMIISGLWHAEQLFFRARDMWLVKILPVPMYKIVLSKLTVFFTEEWLMTFLFSYPLFIAYGLVGGMPGWFYALALLYPFCSFLLETGFVLLFITPLHVLIQFFKRHRIVYAAAVILIMLVLSVVYYILLSLFIQISTNNQEALFATRNLDLLRMLFNKAIPLIWLVRAFVESNWQNFGLFVAFSLGLLVIDSLVFVGAYSPSLRFQTPEKAKKRLPKYRKIPLTLTLIQKELALLVHSDRLFSFIALLLVQPFLLSLVVNAMNRIFVSGMFLYFTVYLPQFIPMTAILMVLLFTMSINQSSNRYFPEEESMAEYLKTLPITYRKQIGIKLAIPYVCSLLSLLASCLVMVLTGIMSINAAIGAVVLAAVLLCGFEFASLYCELNGKRWILYIYLYALPVLFWAGGILLSYFQVHFTLLVLSGAILFGLSALPFLPNIVRKTSAKEVNK